MTAYPSEFSWLPTGTVLVGEYGSRAHGTGNENSDRDFHAIRVEPRAFVTGLSQFDSIRHSSAKEGHKSGPDDLDTTVYGLRKWATLAAAGNPNMYVLLHLPKYEVLNDVGRMLLNHRHLFASKAAAPKFLGYLDSQKKAMLGERGARVQRPELVAKHSFDTKFGYHMVKLGLQGLELIRTGQITIPFDGEQLTTLRGIRAGEYTLDDVVGMSDELTAQIRAAAETSNLPDQPDYTAINRLLNNMYETSWAQE
ncbi:nucleotidyltransferase domain-containing protein [Curtobacterium sp. MCBD17_040]|uniref:nucleotidyltransferase domain-containing protein n=1 Tax=Curtobacterium sp. MCBD17_040 TaxID=2175674 RepID=UPI000DA6F24B|nr:nucleotidyltransferase domain-containing protein [Curtobacterium sp. MCBD17_040]WIB65374.1 nucleotidyltransferase domain-containing protein [Curtobacterium sp. MCBD17_040]